MATDAKIAELRDAIENAANKFKSLVLESRSLISNDNASDFDWNNLLATNPDVLSDPADNNSDLVGLQMSGPEVANCIGGLDELKNFYDAAPVSQGDYRGVTCLLTPALSNVRVS